MTEYIGKAEATFSQRGKVLLIFDKYKFYMHRKYADKDIWRCINKNAPQIHTCNEYDVGFTSGHNHTKINSSELIKIGFNNGISFSAIKTPDSFNKIMATELSKLDSNERSCLPQNYTFFGE